MTDEHRNDEDAEEKHGLFQRYPKLGVLLVAVIAYGILLAMCVIVAILIYRG
jgi:hypothetical protein